jgi:hypothetical protein
VSSPPAANEANEESVERSALRDTEKETRATATLDFAARRDRTAQAASKTLIAVAAAALAAFAILGVVLGAIAVMRRTAPAEELAADFDPLARRELASDTRRTLVLGDATSVDRNHSGRPTSGQEAQPSPNVNPSRLVTPALSPPPSVVSTVANSSAAVLAKPISSSRPKAESSADPAGHM